MSMVIKCTLDTNSIQAAIDEIRAYREDLNNKLQQFITTLLQDGVTVANARLSSTVGDSVQGVIGFGVNNGGDIVSAIISLEGADALFIEFGAGIAYNTGIQHPDADEFGYGPGTYPSKHPPNKAINPGYWFYREDGELVKSIGTQASMPMYHAAETIRNNAIQRASEIFRS